MMELGGNLEFHRISQNHIKLFLEAYADQVAQDLMLSAEPALFNDNRVAANRARGESKR
jgi:hypothetical protein